MLKIAKILQDSRDKSGFTLSQLSGFLNIDAAVLSKLENGKRSVSKNQLYQFIDIYKLNEKETFIAWLTDKIIYEIGDEAFAIDALKVAEDEIQYGLSKNISPDSALQEMLDQIDELKIEWQSKRPIKGIQLEKMKEYFDLNYTFESNRIEGNTLTLQETFFVIKEGLTVHGKSLNEHLEAINHSEAIDFLVELVKRKEMVTERLLQEIHYLVLKGIDRKNAGKYRTVPVIISGSAHKPPQPYLIARQMEMVFEYNREMQYKIHPVLMAAEMHERIVTVHPFIDGNGRTSRLMMNLILLMNGFTIAIIKGDVDSRQEYYTALEQCRTSKNKFAFHKLVAKYCIDSLKQHIDLAV